MSVYNMAGYSGGNDVKKIKSYLFMLNEQLRYMFANMNPDENFSQETLQEYRKDQEDLEKLGEFTVNINVQLGELEEKTEGLSSTVQDQQGNISVLQQTAESLTSKISDAEGNISVLQQTATTLTSQIGDAQGNISVLQQTAESLTSQVSSAQGDISILQQTATALTSQVSNAQGDISILQQTAESLTSQVSSAKGDISILQQTATTLTSQVKDATGDISTLQQTAKTLTSEVSTAKGNISTLQQTATSLTSRVSTAEGSISTLQQTAKSLTSEISDAKENLTKVTQTANKIDWIVKSGTSATNFTLTSRMASLVAENIDLTGYVTFNSLEKAGSTKINGGNITTGTLDAKLLEINGTKVFGTDSKGRFVLYKDFMNYNVASFEADSLTADKIKVKEVYASLSSIAVKDNVSMEGTLTATRINMKNGGSIYNGGTGSVVVSGLDLKTSLNLGTSFTWSPVAVWSSLSAQSSVSDVVGRLNNVMPSIVTALNALGSLIDKMV